MDKSAAATTIQRIWRGARQRRHNAELAQQNTPHQTNIEYFMATHAYSVKNVAASSNQNRQIQARAYRDTAFIPKDGFAYLHSFQRQHEFKEFIKKIAEHPPSQGEIYRPGAPENHDMKANNAWLLGLAHHKKSLVLSVPLDDTTIVRNSSRDSPQELQTTDHNLSALAREVLGLVQSGHYSVSNLINPDTGNIEAQAFEPKPSAKHAKLEDFQTPHGMPKPQLRSVLQHAGVNVQGITRR
ncbi:hypothetical protein [Burkholderia cepacia]|uniref:hypothetical protein n=1 Tax=Burkholderia cepacia TaxID=292 RepID=UPI0015891887|nr:hypothetical protein [Burkholderia cepacia]